MRVRTTALLVAEVRAVDQSVTSLIRQQTETVVAADAAVPLTTYAHPHTRAPSTDCQVSSHSSTKVLRMYTGVLLLYSTLSPVCKSSEWLLRI